MKTEKTKMLLNFFLFAPLLTEQQTHDDEKSTYNNDRTKTKSSKKVVYYIICHHVFVPFCSAMRGGDNNAFYCERELKAKL